MTEHRTPPTTRAMRITWVVFSTALIVIAAVVIYLAIWGSGESQGKDAETAGRVAAQGQAKSLAEQVDEACKNSPVAARQQRLNCAQAKEIVEQGPAGPTGPPGAVGPQGPPGRDGRDGITPPCALQANRCVGPTGAIGAQGPIGKTGLVGPAGPKGDKGDTGETGAQGPKGDAGLQGEKGDKGDPGTNGTDGVDGTNGTDGEDGVDGKNAYPFKFSFIIPAEPPLTTARTYDCQINDPNAPAECELRSTQ